MTSIQFTYYLSLFFITILTNFTNKYFVNANLSNLRCTTDETKSTYLEKLEWNRPFPVRCDNKFVGIYREHISKVKSKIVLGNKKSLDINIIPTLIDPTFGTEPYTADLKKIKTIRCKNGKGEKAETAFVHKDRSIKEPMNVTVSLLHTVSVLYDIQVMAVLRGDAGFYQTMRLQCKDLSEDTTSHDKVLRWSCLPLNCDSEVVACQDPGIYSGDLKVRAATCNKNKCCPKNEVPLAWKKDANYMRVCSNVKC